MCFVGFHSGTKEFSISHVPQKMIHSLGVPHRLILTETLFKTNGEDVNAAIAEQNWRKIYKACLILTSLLD